VCRKDRLTLCTTCSRLHTPCFRHGFSYAKILHRKYKLYDRCNFWCNFSRELGRMALTTTLERSSVVSGYYRDAPLACFVGLLSLIKLGAAFSARLGFSHCCITISTPCVIETHTLDLRPEKDLMSMRVRVAVSEGDLHVALSSTIKPST
jgi:hypothetical protein